MTGIWRKILSALALVGVWILIWETAFRLSGKEDWQSIPPTHVLQELWSGVAGGTFLRSLGASLLRVVYGFGVALVVGSILGLLLATSSFVNWLVGPLILGVQSLPSICWMPLAVLWFGLGEWSILFVVLMGSLGSVAVATRDGVRQMPVTYSRVASTFGTNWYQRLLWVSIPAALPVFISGLKQGWTFAWRSLLAGELLYRVIGVGGALTEARDLADYPKMFAVMILIVLVSVLVDKVIFSRLEERVRVRWGLAGK